MLPSSLLVSLWDALQPPERHTTHPLAVPVDGLCLGSVTNDTAFSTWRQKSLLHGDCRLGSWEGLGEVGLGSEVHRMKMKKPVLVFHVLK